MNRRLATDKIVKTTVLLLSALTVVPLLLIIGTIVAKGIGQINFDFFTQATPSSLEAMTAKAAGNALPGGIANGIVGSLMMVLLASLLSIPPGILAGVYLSEKRHTRPAAWVRFSADMLQGAPSVVVGIIAYLLVVVPMGGYSAAAGAVALAVMMLPPIVRTTEESMNRLPVSLKEATLSLGCSYPNAVFRVMIPAASGGIRTGVILSAGRVIGEAAPLMMTALGSNLINPDYDKPASAVPLLIWQFYNDPNLADMVWGSSLFLLFLTLGLNVAAKEFGSKKK